MSSSACWVLPQRGPSARGQTRGKDPTIGVLWHAADAEEEKFPLSRYFDRECRTLSYRRGPRQAQLAKSRPCRAPSTSAESRLGGGADGAARIDPRKSAIEALDLIDQFDRLIPTAWPELGRDDEVCFIRIGLHDPRSLKHCTDIGFTPGNADQDAWQRFVGARGIVSQWRQRSGMAGRVGE